jgi:exopolysaccharide biosynthesis polyprenyl glycosylphosphotransferase
MLRQFSVKRIVVFFIFDWLITIASLILAAVIRIHFSLPPDKVFPVFGILQLVFKIDPSAMYSGTNLPFTIFIAISIIWPIIFNLFFVYDGRKNENINKELWNISKAICVSTILLAGLLFFSYRELSRGMFLIFFILDIATICGARFALWLFRRIQKKRSIVSSPHSILIIGAGVVGQRLAKVWVKGNWVNIEIMGFLDDDPGKRGMNYHGVPVLGSLDQVNQIIKKYSIRDVVIALPLRAYSKLIEMCNLLQKQLIRVYVVPDLFSLSFPNASLDGFGGIPVIDLGLPGIQGITFFYKRIFDIVITIITLIILSPILFVVIIAIKLDSPGPLFYEQERIGKKGIPFKMYKFRSMFFNSDASIHQEYVTKLIVQNQKPDDFSIEQGNDLKMKNDPRITRVGKWIRKLSIDELPQLINVFRGEMSLVGPRPPLPYELAHYKEWHLHRLEVLPGMTGLWQVKGRNRVSFDEMVRMDLDYIQRQSVGLDLLILLQTPFAVLSAKGAG